MIDYAVIGGGVGGISIASMLKDVILFEKEPYLGGCSSTFKKGDYLFNTGATTFAPFESQTPIYEYITKYNIKLDSLQRIDPAIVVKIQDKEIHRYQDMDKFIDEIDRIFPNSQNGNFWRLIKNISDEFYKNLNIYYSKTTLLELTKTIVSSLALFGKFYKYIFANAKESFKEILGDIPKEYQEFLDNQILIVAQTKSENTNFLVASLSLSYTFYENFYSFGGMGEIVNDIAKNIDRVITNCEIQEIIKERDEFILKSKTTEFRAKNIILNSSIFESATLFKDESIKKYYQKLNSLESYQGAFMLYLVIKSREKFHHHYQVIQEKNFKNMLSNSIFVSFSDEFDNKMAKDGEYSVTISTHTDIRIWQNLDSDSYKIKKLESQNEILQAFLENFSLSKDSIVKSFGATPKTFQRYIKRSSVGGIPMSYKNFFFGFPSHKTPFKGIYNIGDTTFAGQGWCGTIYGAVNLKKSLNN